MDSSFARAPVYLPVSESQRMMWLLDRMAPGDHAYNLAFVMRLTGTLDVRALERALTRLHERHEALRSSFVYREGELHCAVAPHVPERVLSIVSDELDARFVDRLREVAEAPFDLANGPLFRATLFRRNDADSVLCLCTHHIVSDFKSFEVVLSELESDCLAAPGPLADGRSYVDFVHEERAYLNSAAGAKSIEHWRHRLAETGGGAASVNSASDGTHACFFRIPTDLRRRLDEVGRTTKCGLRSVMLACWSVLLSERTRHETVVIGLPTSLRDASYSSTIGNFINPLPVVLRVDSKHTYAALITDCFRQTLLALGHRRVPFNVMVSQLQQRRDATSNPIFQSALNFVGPETAGRFTDLYLNDASAFTMEWAGLQVAPLMLSQQEGQLDLALDVIESSSGLRCNVKGRASKVSARELDGVRDRFLELLEDVSRDPTRAIPRPRGESPRTTDANRSTLVSLFDEVATATPDSTAIAYAGRSMTYSELQGLSRRLANDLIARGLQRGERVGIDLDPSERVVVAMLGIMRAGATYVPLERDQPLARRREVRDRCAVRFVVGEGSHDLEGTGTFVDLDRVASDETPIDRSAAQAIAYTLFTSGSTGRPKGIDVRQENVVHLLDVTRRLIETTPDDVWCWFHATSFDLSVWEIWGALTSGAKLVVTPRELRRDPIRFVEFVASERITVLQLTPSALKLVRLATLDRSRPTWSLKHLVSCGEALLAETANYFLSWSSSVWNMYGPAEATVYSTYFAVERPIDDARYVPIGRSLDGYRIYLLDDDGNEVEGGSEGEIYIGGAGVAAGYVGEPELTTSRFVVDTIARDGSRMYRTGDYAVRSNGVLTYLGRRDQQVKVHGFRVELLEVEGALRKMAIVRDAAVIAAVRADQTTLFAFVVIRPEHAEDWERTLERRLREVLPAYMIPSIYFRLPELPLNAHEKVDRAALAAMIGPRPVPEATTTTKPTAEVEPMLVAFWREALGRSDFSRDDSFFEVGGDSFSLVKVFGRMEETGLFPHVTLTDLFRHPTIAGLSSFASGGAAPSAAAVRPIAHGRRQAARRFQ